MPRETQLWYIASEIREEEHPVRRDTINIKGGGGI